MKPFIRRASRAQTSARGSLKVEGLMAHEKLGIEALRRGASKPTVLEVKDDGTIEFVAHVGELDRWACGDVLGATLKKMFRDENGEMKPFMGTIVEIWLDADYRSVAHVIYEDGDEEDLYLAQITPITGHTKKRKLGATPPPTPMRETRRRSCARWGDRARARRTRC